MKYLALLVLLSACGPYEVKVNDITVHHEIDLNFEQVMLYCQNQCQYITGTAYDPCVNSCYTQTVQAILSGVTAP